MIRPEQIKDAMNEPVRYEPAGGDGAGLYILTGAIFRKNESGFYYQLELTNLRENSIVIARLEDVNI